MNLIVVIAELIRHKFNVDISVFYRTLKSGSYFQLKSSTSAALVSNVVYRFSGLRDAGCSANRYVVFLSHFTS